MECEISQPRPAQGATETAGAELRVPLPEREPLPRRRPRRRLACSLGPCRLASGRSPSWPSSSAPAPGGGLSGPARLCPSVRTAGWAVSGVAYGAPAAGTPRSIQSATSSVLETPAAHAPEHGPPPASLCGRPDPEQLPWGPLGQRPLFSPSPVPPPEGAWEASGGADGDTPGKQRLVLLRARSTPHAEAGVPQAAGKPVSPPCRKRQAAVLGGAGPWAWGKGGQRRDGRGAALLGTPRLLTTLAGPTRPPRRLPPEPLARRSVPTANSPSLGQRLKQLPVAEALTGVRARSVTGARVQSPLWCMQAQEHPVSRPRLTARARVCMLAPLPVLSTGERDREAGRGGRAGAWCVWLWLLEFLVEAEGSRQSMGPGPSGPPGSMLEAQSRASRRLLSSPALHTCGAGSPACLILATWGWSAPGWGPG